jgi:hypothetical protein
LDPDDEDDTPAPITPGGYRVVGKEIQDAAGNRKLFYGINRPSFEWNANGEGDDSAYGNIANWGANVVRIPMNLWFWQSNQDGYRSRIQGQVNTAKNAGLDVILDLHRNGGNEQTSDENRFAARSALDFWTQVAGTFKDDGRVLFELYNEPHDIPWSTWRNGNGEFAGMQEMYDAVRATGAHNLVLVGGLNWAYDLTGIGAGIDGYNIVYTPHIYDWPGKQPDQWGTYIGGAVEDHPILLTEFGTDNGDCGASFDSQVIAWADQRDIGWVAWAWYPGDCGFPALIQDWGGNPTTKGQLIQTQLQNR